MLLYKNKRDWIVNHVRGKKVLDLGCVQHSTDRSRDPEWLHAIIVKHARSVVGVDILDKETAELKSQGYNIVCANVETMDLQDRFELIVAGDLIEHLSNPGLFLDRVVAHLAPGGVFLITTPNPVTFMRFVTLFFSGCLGANKEHTSWFTQQVLKELARRSRLEIVAAVYVDDTYQYYRGYSKIWQPLLGLNYVLCRLRPQMAETLCFALKRVEDAQ